MFTAPPMTCSSCGVAPATEEARSAAYSRNKDVLIKTLSATYKKMRRACERKDVSEAYSLDAEYHRDIEQCSLTST